MTLSVGNHLHKLDDNGKPSENESNVEYEIEGITKVSYQQDAERELVIIKKVR